MRYKGGDLVSLADKIKGIISEHLNVEPADLTETTSFDDLNADSLDVVELMMAVEEEFGITVDEEAAKTFKTVTDVAQYIDKA